MSRRHKGEFRKSLHRTDTYRRYHYEQRQFSKLHRSLLDLYRRAERLGLDVQLVDGNTLLWRRPDPHQPWQTETLRYFYRSEVAMLSLRDVIECYESRQSHFRRFRAQIAALSDQASAAQITVEPSYAESFWVICHHPSPRKPDVEQYYCYDLSGTGLREFRKLVRSHSS